MHNRFSRAASVLGDDAMDRLAASRVAVFGIGGVGGFVVEALARCGVGTLDLIDSDKVTETNINRQITAACSTVGEYKTDVAERRIADISPETRVNNHKIFFLPETADSFDFSQYDYVVDATDTVRAKLEIIERCNGSGTPIISCMGCGNRIDPEKLHITDIYKTDTDPLARTMRKELRARGIKRCKVLCSTEPPIMPAVHNIAYKEEPGNGKRTVPGSVSFVPSAAGLIIASAVVRDITKFSYDGRAKLK